MVARPALCAELDGAWSIRPNPLKSFCVMIWPMSFVPPASWVRSKSMDKSLLSFMWSTSLCMTLKVGLPIRAWWLLTRPPFALEETIRTASVGLSASLCPANPAYSKCGFLSLSAEAVGRAMRQINRKSKLCVETRLLHLCLGRVMLIPWPQRRKL